jgi:murein L,D-transpeptidase YafK
LSRRREDRGLLVMSNTIMKIFIVLLLLLPNITFAVELPKAELVLVKKSERKMYLIKNNKPFREYKVAFGANPEGHKQQEGDERTPEGKYILDYKKSDSA